MFEVRPLTREQVRTIYETRMKKDFPADELRPYASIVSLTKKGAYDAFGVFDGEEILGYALFVRKKSRRGEKPELLLDYFAVSAERRGEGIGSAFLGLLGDYFRRAECVLCETESPDTARDDAEKTVRERRIDFYLRSGFVDTGARARTFGVDYIILESTAAGQHDADRIRELYRGLYSRILPRLMLRRFICVS